MTKIEYRLLSLPKDVARRESFFKQPSANLFKVVDAIWKEDPCVDKCFNIQKSQEYYGRLISRGEMACSLSHIRIYQEFLKTDAKWLVVCEDDAVLSDNFDVLPQILSRPYHHMEVLLFGQFKGLKFTDKDSHLFKYPIQYFPYRYQGYKIGKLYKNFSAMTVGYAVSRLFVSRIVTYLETTSHQIYWKADDWRAIINALNYSYNCIYHIVPRLVIEHPSCESNLEHDRTSMGAIKRYRWLSRVFYLIKNGVCLPFKKIIAIFR